MTRIFRLDLTQPEAALLIALLAQATVTTNVAAVADTAQTLGNKLSLMYQSLGADYDDES